MLAALAPLTVALALAQATAPEVHALKHVPDQADVVVRVSNLSTARDDVATMLKAMSPMYGPQVAPVLDQGLAMFGQLYGDEATKNPFVVAVRIVQPEGPGAPPFAVIVPARDPKDVLEVVAGPGAKLVEKDGLQTFTGKQGETIYTASGADFAAFGPDRTLVDAIAKQSSETGGNVAKALDGPLGKSFGQGDIGVYANLGALAARYKDQIEGARQQFFGMLDMAAQQQGGNPGMMGAVKQIYGALFDSAGDLDSLTLSIDAAAAGLAVDGTLTAKPGTKAGKFLAELKPAGTEGLAKLPADLGTYTFFNMDAALAQQFQAMSTSLISADGKPTPGTEQAVKLLADLGTTRTYGGMSMGSADGMRGLAVAEAKDASALVEAQKLSIQSLAGQDNGALAGMFKSVTFAPGAESYKGFTFNKTTMTVDVEKLGGAESPGGKTILNMYGGDTISTFTGTDGKVVLTVFARDFAAAKPLIDAYLTPPSSPLGSKLSYVAVRKQFPDQVSVLGLVSAQAIVKQIVGQLASTLGNGAIKVPSDLPAEPVFFGGAAEPVPGGVHIKAVLPSEAGPVFEKGILPVIQALQGRVDN
jgi:hypothetical protein